MSQSETVERIIARHREDAAVAVFVAWAKSEQDRLMYGGHACESCEDCLHDGAKCCGCYDGACCHEPEGEDG